MISREDLFEVQVTDQMILDAVHYAEKSLHYTFNRMGSGNLNDRVRNIVKGLVMESAFRRLLDVHRVQYDLLGNTHWTKKDRYDVGIGGHKFDVKGFFISEQWKATSILKNPGWLLDCCALVPSDQVNARSLKEDDYYVFPFMIGEVERTNGPDLFNLDRFRYLIHPLWDYAWTKNDQWNCLGRLTLRSDLESPLHLRLGGQGHDQEIIIEEITLEPGASFVTRHEFFTLLFAQTNEFPSGGFTIHCDTNQKVEEVTLQDWGNIWIYDAVVYITGYMTKSEFRAKSTEIPRFYKDCKQYGETKTVNRRLLIQELHPLYPILPATTLNHIPAKP